VIQSRFFASLVLRRNLIVEDPYSAAIYHFHLFIYQRHLIQEWDPTAHPRPLGETLMLEDPLLED
jgi:hypothetical protein